MEYTQVTYKIPVGSQETVDRLVSLGIERYLREVTLIVAPEKVAEFEQAVDSTLRENNWEAKFTKEDVKKEALVDKEVVREEIDEVIK